jgi:hypothetical protein
MDLQNFNYFIFNENHSARIPPLEKSDLVRPKSLFDQ